MNWWEAIGTIAALLACIFLLGVFFGAGLYAGVKLGTRWFGTWKTLVYKDWGVP